MQAKSKSNPSPAERLNVWIARHWRLLAIVILALAALLRVVYFTQAAGGPLAVLHRWDQSDMNHFDSWARQINSGDWLSRNVAPPLHDWHVDVVRRQLLAHPDRASALIAAGVKLDDPTTIENTALKDEARRKWNDWIGGGRMYQDPLYPYLIAITYKLLGDDPRWVFAWQMTLGVVCVGLVMLIARRCFGETAGALAGLLSALNGPMMFYEFVLLRETAVTLAGLLIVWLAMRAMERPTWGRWLGTGLAIGIAMLLKSQFVLLVPGLIVLLAIEHRRRIRATAQPAAMMLAGALIAVAPLMARNLAVGLGPLAGAGNAAPSVVLSGAADAGPMFWGLDHVADIMDQTHGRLMLVMLATMKTHENLGGVLALMWGKFLTLWHWYEIPNNENFYYARLAAPVLAWMPVTWPVIAPLGVVGLVLGARRWRIAGPLYLLAVCNLALLVVFFVLSRLRMPLAVALIPFAAFTLAHSIHWCIARRWRAVGFTALAVAVLAFWTCPALPRGMTTIRLGDYASGFLVHWLPQIEKAEQTNDTAAIEAIFADALKHQDRQVGELGVLRKASSQREADIARFFAELYTQHAKALRMLGREPEAKKQEQRAAQLQAAY